MVRGRANAFVAGPPLLKAATGEIAPDDGIIDPRDARIVLGFALSIRTENRYMKPIQFGVARP